MKYGPLPLEFSRRSQLLTPMPFMASCSFIVVFLSCLLNCGALSLRNRSAIARPKVDAALCTLARTRHSRARPLSFSCQRSNPEGLGTDSGLGYPLRPEPHVPSITVGKRRGAETKPHPRQHEKSRFHPMFIGSKENRIFF